MSHCSGLNRARSPSVVNVSHSIDDKLAGVDDRVDRADGGFRMTMTQSQYVEILAHRELLYTNETGRNS